MTNEEKQKLLKPGERVDDLQIGGLELIQNPAGFCFGVDAVFLSDFVKVRAGERALDLGTGNGIIPVLLSAKTEAWNGLEDRVEIVTGDIREASQIFKPVFFDVITTNPPYMPAEHGIRNADSARAAARHEVLCTLDDILRESMRLLQDKGRFYMIHRPFRLTEIMIKMSRYKIEPKRIQFIHPYADREPVLLMVEGVRGARPGVKVDPPIIIYENRPAEE